MKVTIKQLILLSAGFFIIIFGLFQGADAGFLMNLTIWYYSFAYCLFDIKGRLGYACFLATFFLFLLGGYAAHQFFHYSEKVVLFDDKITTHMYLSIGIALVGLFLGNLFQSHIRTKNVSASVDNKHYISAMRSVSKIGFYFSYIPYLFTELLQVSFVRSSGYTEIYLNSGISLPFFIKIIAYSAPIFLFMYLSTLPAKKECSLSIYMYLLYSAISLLSGQRSTFVINCMTVFLYYMYRDSLNTNEKWVSKKKLTVIFLLLPVAAILLNIYGQIRFGNTDIKAFRSFFDSILDVFTSQGVSISVIGYEKYYENNLPDKLYSLSGIIGFLKYNPISSIIFNYTEYTGQNAERALNGELFTHAISYFVLPYNYVRGRGLGSSYIAEVYHDFSYIGIFVVSFIYGIILKVCSNFNRNRVWLRFACLMIMNTILMAPRSTTDSFISNFAMIQVIFAVSFVWGISNILYNREKGWNGKRDV